ncbi:hypothetical protein [Mycolicibacterium gilvum]|uniref:hypothetical protein n=1 Tax=Mycolicibacterium gilvum TaxID=1804 RepID=UPI0040452047
MTECQALAHTPLRAALPFATTMHSKLTFAMKSMGGRGRMFEPVSAWVLPVDAMYSLAATALNAEV